MKVLPTRLVVAPRYVDLSLIEEAKKGLEKK